MPMPSKSVILFNQTSGANAALDTDTTMPAGIDTSDYEALDLLFTAAGGTHGGGTVVIGTRQPAVYANQATYAIPAASAWAKCTVSSSSPSLAGQTGSVPATITSATRVQVPAGGVGVTTQLIVIGRRQFRGDVLNPNTVDGVAPRVLD